MGRNTNASGGDSSILNGHKLTLCISRGRTERVPNSTTCAADPAGGWSVGLCGRVYHGSGEAPPKLVGGDAALSCLPGA